MRFIHFTAMTENGLNKKVNRFLEENPNIEIIKFDYSAGSGSFGVALLYRYLSTF
ncbi:hypothetical protein GCM10007342_08840 [Staphylococcus pragensis]|nr:hypothetical protein GCM10007342_08840 [Staphylococcus pragensis]